MMLFATSSFALHFSGRAAATLKKGGRSTVTMAADLKMPTPLTQLEQLATMTTLSIDTGDLDVIESYAKGGLITDATTNPLTGGYTFSFFRIFFSALEEKSAFLRCRATAYCSARSRENFEPGRGKGDV